MRPEVIAELLHNRPFSSEESGERGSYLRLQNLISRIESIVYLKLSNPSRAILHPSIEEYLEQNFASCLDLVPEGLVIRTANQKKSAIMTEVRKKGKVISGDTCTHTDKLSLVADGITPVDHELGNRGVDWKASFITRVATERTIEELHSQRFPHLPAPEDFLRLLHQHIVRLKYEKKDWLEGIDPDALRSTLDLLIQPIGVGGQQTILHVGDGYSGWISPQGFHLVAQEDRTRSEIIDLLTGAYGQVSNQKQVEGWLRQSYSIKAGNSFGVITFSDDFDMFMDAIASNHNFNDLFHPLPNDAGAVLLASDGACEVPDHLPFFLLGGGLMNLVIDNSDSTRRKFVDRYLVMMGLLRKVAATNPNQFERPAGPADDDLVAVVTATPPNHVWDILNQPGVQLAFAQSQNAVINLMVERKLISSDKITMAQIFREIQEEYRRLLKPIQQKTEISATDIDAFIEQKVIEILDTIVRGLKKTE